MYARVEDEFPEQAIKVREGEKCSSDAGEEILQCFKVLECRTTSQASSELKDKPPCIEFGLIFSHAYEVTTISKVLPSTCHVETLLTHLQ